MPPTPLNLLKYNFLISLSIKICLKWEPKLSQIEQNGAQERSWKQLGSRWRREGAPRPGLLSTFGTTLSIWGALFYPAGRQGVQKSRIFAPSRFKNQKNDIQEGGPEKALNIDRTLVGKSELLRNKNLLISFVSFQPL